MAPPAEAFIPANRLEPCRIRSAGETPKTPLSSGFTRLRCEIFLDVFLDGARRQPRFRQHHRFPTQPTWLKA